MLCQAGKCLTNTATTAAAGWSLIRTYTPFFAIISTFCSCISSNRKLRSSVLDLMCVCVSFSCRRQPLGDRFHLNRDGREKLPESGWKFVFYLVSWCSVAHVVLVQEGGRFLQRPSSIWTGSAQPDLFIPSIRPHGLLIRVCSLSATEYRIESSVPSSIYVIYAAQASFYLHSVYATLFLDVWRKDSLVLLLHHVITTVLLCVSWSARLADLATRPFVTSSPATQVPLVRTDHHLPPRHLRRLP